MKDKETDEMKKKNLLLKVVALCMVLSFAVLNVPVTSNAATKKVTCKVYKSRKKSPLLKTGTTYQITNKGSKVGYVRFEAPKTKVYTFSFSDYRTLGVSKSKDIGYAYAMAYDDDCFKKMEKNKDLIVYLDWESIQYDNNSFGNSVEIASKKYSDITKKEALESATQEEYDEDLEDAEPNIVFDKEEADNYYRVSNKSTMKLKKGKVIYLKLGNMVDETLKNKGFTCKLKIK